MERDSAWTTEHDTVSKSEQIKITNKKEIKGVKIGWFFCLKLLTLLRMTLSFWSAKCLNGGHEALQPGRTVPAV